MSETSSDYDPKVEFLDNNQFIDEEDEFRSFCLNLIEPGQVDPNLAQASTNSNAHVDINKIGHSSAGENTNNGSYPSSSQANNFISAQSIGLAGNSKPLKPSFVQSLRPDSASVPDDDIRLSYAKLLFKTFNGLEKDDILQKLRSICVEDCFMSVKWIGERGNPCGPNYRDVTGVSLVSLWLEAIMTTAIPDAVVQLQDSKLRVRPDKSSYLLCKYTFNGTQINKIEPASKPSGETAAANPFDYSNINKSFNVPSATTSTTSTADNKRQRTETSSTDSLSGNPTPNTTTATTNTHTSASASASASANSVPPRQRNSSSSNNTSNNKRSATEAAPVSDNINKGPYEAAQMLDTVLKMSIVGTLIIHINADKRIFRFEYIQKLIRLNAVQ